MRILRLDIQGSRFEFHPYMSVLPDLSTENREILLDVLRGLPTGSAPPASGLLEVYGVLLDLNQSNLELLDLVPTVPGDAASVDVVVRRDQLPGAGLPLAARDHANLASRRDVLLDELHDAEAAAHRAELALAAGMEALEALGGAVDAASAGSLDAPRRAIETSRAERQAAEKALGDALIDLTSAQQAHAGANAALDEAQGWRATLTQAMSDATAALEAARASRDPFAAAALDAARQRFAELEDEHGDRAAVDAEDGRTADEVSDQIAALEAARQSLEASLLSLDAVDPYPVEVALAQIENEGHVSELVPSDEAQAIADQWVSVVTRLSSDQPTTGGDPAALRAARTRLNAARAALFEAERAIRLPDMTQEDADALEDAHEQVVATQYKLTKRLSRSKALQRIDRVLEREQEILDRIGYRTYTDYVMGTATLKVDPVKQHALDEARRELAAAEDDLSSLQQDVNAELVRAELRYQQKVLRLRAIEVLGEDPGDDVEWALRQLRVPPPAGGRRFDRLRRALEAAGVALAGEDVPATMLVDAAKLWLAEQRDTAAQRTRIEAELSANDGALAAAQQSAAETAGVVADNAERRRRHDIRLREARSALSDAHERVKRHAEAEREVAAARAELERASADEEAAGAEATRLEQALVSAAEEVHAREAAVVAAEHALAIATSAEQQAVAALSELEEQLEQAGVSDPAALERSVAEATEAAKTASLERERVRAEVAAVEARLADLPAPEVATTQDASEEELEWYVLSRLAAQRSVSFAGSVPFVLDDALTGLPKESLEHMLESLERMTVAVQIFVLSDDPQITLWAHNVGPDRAAIVHAERIV